MKVWTVLLASLLAAACATVPAPPQSDRLFADALFGAPSHPIRADDVFAVSPEMRRFLATEIPLDLQEKGPQRALFNALYRKQQLQLDYDAAITRNAAEAFAARAGNCLSLVIMTAAFAKEMDLTVTYQQVYTDETWGRVDDVTMAIGHVNLTLGMRSSFLRYSTYEAERLTIDFLPPSDTRGMRSQVLGERTIVAMYMNNRAVESMLAGRVDDAYWWVREAIVHDPTLLSAYNTLGVVYERHGNLAQAERALNHVLAREPGNTRVMPNLVRVLRAQGRAAEANALERELARLEPEPPFSFYKRGIAALRTGDYRTAKELFAREVERAPYYHEFHFALAAAHLGLGEQELARRHLELAIAGSPTPRDRDLYTAKLDRINAQRGDASATH